MKQSKTTKKSLPFLLILGNILMAQPTEPILNLGTPIEQTVETATRTSRLLSEVPIKTEVLGSDAFDLEVRSSLGEAIELLNGARTEANCQNCGTAEIQLLGLSGNYNQILFDGKPLFPGVAGVYGIDQIPTILVDRIEIVKGGASALYGPGAVAGVINVLPIEPFDTSGKFEYTYRNIDGSDRNEFQFKQSFVSQSLPLKGTIYGLWDQQDPYDANGDGFTDLVERETKTLGTYLLFNPSDKTELTFQYQRIEEDRRGGDRLDREPQFSQVAEKLETNYQWATLAIDQTINENADFSVSASIVDYQRDSFYGGTGDQIVADISKVNATTKAYDNIAYNAATTTNAQEANKAIAIALFGEDGAGGSYHQFGDLESTTYLFDSQINYNLDNVGLGTHILTLGWQHEHEDLYDTNTNASGVKISTLHDQTYYNSGLYLQNQWSLTQRAELVPGIRIDKAKSLEDAVISPRIAFRYTWSDQLTLRTNFSTGFLAPRIFDEDIHIDTLAGKPIDIVNHPDLKEERSRTFAIGFDYAPDSLQGNLITSLQAYHTTIEDAFNVGEDTTDSSASRGVKTRTNTEGSTVTGLEWDLSWAPTENVRIDTGLAYIATRYKEKQEVFSGNQVFSDRYNKTPDASGLIQLTYLNKDWGDLSLGLKWTGPMEVQKTTDDDAEEGEIIESDAFYVLNTAIRREFTIGNIHLHGKVGIHNVLDDYQDDLEKGAGRDAGYVYGPRFPRTFFIGVDIEY